jgi:hypothetical protein
MAKPDFQTLKGAGKMEQHVKVADPNELDVEGDLDEIDKKIEKEKVEKVEDEVEGKTEEAEKEEVKEAKQPVQADKLIDV